MKTTTTIPEQVATAMLGVFDRDPAFARMASALIEELLSNEKNVTQVTRLGALDSGTMEIMVTWRDNSEHIAAITIWNDGSAVISEYRLGENIASRKAVPAYRHGAIIYPLDKIISWIQ